MVAQMQNPYKFFPFTFLLFPWSVDNDEQAIAAFIYSLLNATLEK
ncbi:hypothetical protein APA_1087 [Pseudanabaena sp. lw0831]|nr:hypothetical protein APA_1087 [Pseudanabaena sp. lw0831]